MTDDSTNIITVIGGANVDIVARYTAQQRIYADSYKGDIATSAGGVARNIAENLAHLGNQIRLICGIGDDDFSKIILESLASADIDTSACYYSKNAASDTYLSLFDNAGELLHAVNQMTLVDSLTSVYLSRLEQEIRQSDYIIADCNLPAEAIAWLIALEGRPKLFFDGVSSDKIIKLKPYLGQFEGLKCNQKEASELTNQTEAEDPLKISQNLAILGLETIILSLGQSGLIYSHHGNHISAQPEPQTEIPVSVSGAGDALFAGIIHGQIHGFSQQNTAQFGLRAAQLTLRCSGAVNSDLSQLIK